MNGTLTILAILTITIVALIAAIVLTARGFARELLRWLEISWGPND